MRKNLSATEKIRKILVVVTLNKKVIGIVEIN